MALQDIFYTLGIIVAVLNIAFLIGASVAAWYVYKFYTNAKNKVMNNTALFMVSRLVSNPLKFSSGMMAMQIVRKIIQMVRGKRRVNRSIG